MSIILDIHKKIDIFIVNKYYVEYFQKIEKILIYKIN